MLTFGFVITDPTSYFTNAEQEVKQLLPHECRGRFNSDSISGIGGNTFQPEQK